jgi:hypothetical protein
VCDDDDDDDNDDYDDYILYTYAYDENDFWHIAHVCMFTMKMILGFRV